jgi:hypothetical protein
MIKADIKRLHYGTEHLIQEANFKPGFLFFLFLPY